MGTSNSYLCGVSKDREETANHSRSDRYAISPNEERNTNNNNDISHRTGDAQAEDDGEGDGPAASSSASYYCTKTDQLQKKEALKRTADPITTKVSTAERKNSCRKTSHNSVLSSIIMKDETPDESTSKNPVIKNNDLEPISISESPHPAASTSHSGAGLSGNTLTPGLTPGPGQSATTPTILPKFLPFTVDGNNTTSQQQFQGSTSLSTSGMAPMITPVSPTAAVMEKHNELHQSRNREARGSLSLSCSLRVTPQPEATGGDSSRRDSRHTFSMSTTPPPASPSGHLAPLHSSPTAMGIVSVVPELEDSMNSTVDWLDDHISRRLGKVTRVASSSKNLDENGASGTSGSTPHATTPTSRGNIIGRVCVSVTPKAQNPGQKKRNSH